MTECDPVTPGEILVEEFLKPMGLSQYRLAKEVGIPAQRISAIVSGKRAISRTRTCGSAGSSVCLVATGYAHRLPTTSKSRNERWVRRWTESSPGRSQPRPCTLPRVAWQSPASAVTRR